MSTYEYDLRERARSLLMGFKGETYAFGLGVLEEAGTYAKEFGDSCLVVANSGAWFKPVVDRILSSLQSHGIALAGGRLVPDAAPNAPREDVYRITTYILQHRPKCLMAVGGGSTIDAVKAANVLASLGRWEPEIEPYFGTGQVSAMLAKHGAKLLPMIAVQSAASSGAHLTKYSNITDPVAGQKKLIVDEAIVPHRSVFDYEVTKSVPVGMTVDGALDGISHSLEVFYGAKEDKYELCRQIAEVGIELAVANVEKAVKDPNDASAREALGLATDIGGYAIMVGGTNGAHLTSFSLVDIASHGRGVALMNPYYTVFFAPAIQDQLRVVGRIYKKYGYMEEDLDALSGRELGEAVAKAMMALGRKLNFPTTLAELPGFTQAHIDRALVAAKNPQLDMKLKNMPVPLDASSVDEYMGPILQAAATGDLSLIKNMK
ncbi:MAG TPA: iron-containing alcohol dehydrogenase [Bacillota bacterium]|nr:iron-containing alcohol dehydrogenase [Bacillota bacterium]HOG52307.1 iron-containing alcohol dehydrogenase [Bacillota bacterium]